jgi:hypothetical protein
LRKVPLGAEASGVGVGVSVVVVVVLVVSSGEAAGLLAGATDSVFCSQATSIAAPNRMQMYLFIDETFGYS